MTLTKNIKFKNFRLIKTQKKIRNLLKKLLNEDNQILKSLSKSYKDSYNKNTLSKLKKYSNIVLIGMGGSILGAKSIYSFLNNKIKKNFILLIVLIIVDLKV